ncbi:hypothetical protein MSAN_00562700 [Mycena sanguinolenta]|uniref:F-box domain-containing protein n=1 Tax=Mycena sanguinolenta TaxID=230812 RepID=A0A8H6Z730_9AGAR|nr:hypothetical protein MSAN_00562700 [Mycena sanguinolenta]
MVLSPQSRLVRLPTELLLVIVHFLCAENPVPLTEHEEKKFPLSPRHLCSLSLVCRRLREICIATLFSHLTVTHTDQLRRLAAKCAVEPEFAGLVRRLDLGDIYSPEEDESIRNAGTLSPEQIYRYGPDILPDFLPRLKALEWLALGAEQIDANMVAIINSHPTLGTVAIRDQDIDALRALLPSTSLSLSKFRVHSVTSSWDLGFQCPELHSLMGRSLRVTNLIVQSEKNVRLGPGDLLVPGLETLHIGVYREPTFPMSWLPVFVGRHPNLQLVKFSGQDPFWTRNPDILFPLQFFDALERASLTCPVNLLSFAISRTSSASSLNDWQIVHLEMETTTEAGISALKIASSMAPGVSSLIIRMPRWAASLSININDLIASLCLFQSLRRLELRYIFGHLLFEAEASWAPPPDPTTPLTSQCALAHAAYRWIAACAAQHIFSLDLVRITDEGRDYLNRLRYPWGLQLTYKAHQNRSIEVCGNPRIFAARQFPKICCKPICGPDPL